MKQRKEIKIEGVRNYLIQHDIYFTEYANGQFQIENISFWATTETWYDAGNQVKGKGLNSFLKYLNLK